MTPTTPRIRFGSSYYPPHHDAGDWARDLDRMRDSGLDTIRTAELLASWDRIEVDRERYDFSWLDEVFDLAEARGIGIVLGTGTNCPPIWMLDEYPDLQVVSSEGVPYPTATSWSWACKDNPGMRRESERWITLLATRYGSRPGLVGWQLDNEPGFPFIARHSESMEVFCYCHHTEEAFREWLQRKYGTPEALSDAWRWDPTHHRYGRWSQVRAPRSTPAHWGVVTAWLDWRRFVAEDLAGQIRWQHDLLKATTPQTPTSTNGFMWSRHDPFGVLIGQDMWRLARSVDVIGYDYYPGISKRFLHSPEYGGMVLDYAVSNARRGGAGLWLSEIESGPIAGWAFGPDHWTTAEDITRINVDCLTTGATNVMYQGYREWNCIPIHWGALVDLRGEPTERLDAASAAIAVAREHEDLLAGSAPVPPEVAILHSWDNATVLEGMGSGERLLEAITGAYRALAGAGFACEFVAEEDLSDVHSKLLVLPATMLLSGAAGEILTAYVRAGGHLLAFAKAAMLDDAGWYWNVRPGAGLSEVLGVQERAVEAAGEVTVTVGESEHLPGWPGGAIAGSWQWQSLRPTDASTVVLGHHADGEPAVTRHGFGSGVGWAVGTHLSASSYDASFAGLIVSIARAAGAVATFEAPLASDGLPRVWGRVRLAGDRAVMSLTSTSDEPLAVSVRALRGLVVDALTGERWDLSGEGTTVDVPARGSRLLVSEGSRADA